MTVALTQALLWMQKIQKASFSLLADDNQDGSEGAEQSGAEPNGTTPQASPWALIDKYMSRMNDDIRQILATSHPILENVANYYFELKVRSQILPLLVFVTLQGRIN
jgi:hypothetical protein